MTDLDRYFDDFGIQLNGAKPPRRRGLALGAGFAVAAIAMLAAVLLLPGGGARPVDAVAAAQRALDPAGQIVYMRIRYGGDRDSGSTVEQWWTDDPVRWRFLQRVPGNGSRLWDMDGPVRGRLELSYAGGVRSEYVSGRNAVLEVRGYEDDAPQARSPGLLGIDGGDPQLGLQAMLAGGEVKDAGEVRVDGRTVRRLGREERPRGGVARRYTYDVDPATFAPVRIAVAFDDARPSRIPPRPTAVIRIEAFERLPLNDETAKLLAVQTNARTKLTRRTAEQQASLVRAYRRCWRSQRDRKERTCPRVARRAIGER